MAPTDHPESAHASTRRLRKFRFPVLLVALFGVMVAVAGINQLVSPVPILALPVGVGLAVACVACYRRLCRTVELRPSVPELEKTGGRAQLWRGALLGSGLFTALMVLIAMFGGWQDVSWGSFGGFLGTAGMMASVAVVEELLFRGVLFRIMEERTGTVLALVVSTLLFGATHLVNANATLWGTLSIALTGGAMTTAAYVATRSLWLPIGLHFAWNFTHAGIFGVVLSGSDVAPNGLLNVTLSGPSALTGGTFGPEASLLALLVCLVPTIVLLRRAARAGQIRRRSPRPKLPA
ncbi:CPBP family intramembrane glutamic endopeptidase [Nonomuraea aridisoli]|uniref:CPBP family intramembrane metalloprotease domain-containing protein n=1 Tax=Nonomuraea aridisoli TaxID=2070368 RepID=A0A2W2EGJ3_9ACTN|nr:CPBP family intramembrane glutamic endopeptidase [Nonomuraea aridisoli]PZG15989.1 CPBP family intramembrane metalloprotease domain-containing protein [Nonomuraea aridisoli]